MIKRTSFWLCFALAVLPPAAAHAIRVESYFSPSARGRRLEVAGGLAIVKFKAGISTAAASAALSAAGFTVDKYIENIGYASVSLPPDMSVTGGISALAAIAAVDSALPNRVFHPNRVPDDPFVNSQYALSRIGAFGAWEYETGASTKVTVAVIDTGIDGSHPELTGKLVGTSRYINPVTLVASDNQLPTPACNHATHVAGVAAASSDNSAGVAGMSWGAHLISYKIFDPADCNADCSDYSSSIRCETSEFAILTAIDELRVLHNSGITGKIVVNMSIGGQGGCSTDLQTSVTNAVNAGLVLVAASGNSYADTIDSPANCLGVISVGATDSSDVLAPFSNTDSDMITKGVSAPGVDIYTTDVGGGYAFASGTSFSSPMTAGLAALLWAAKPTATNTDVKNWIFNSADDLGTAGADRSYGRGRINSLKAMRLAVGETAAFKGETKAVAYPSPFRPGTQRLVAFSVPAEIFSSNAVVKVYTSEGEQVRKLDALTWDGKNEAGADVASGIYIFRVKTDKDSAVGKLALIR